MTKQICEIGASSWFHYKEMCYDAWSHEHKKKERLVYLMLLMDTGVYEYAKYRASR
jgi:hypothetical protein